jgi:hypothetical protein
VKAGKAMSESVKKQCERGNDLISFLYGEVDEREARDFEGHLKFCRECQSELASFGSVRHSIGMWKEEALGGFVSPQVVMPTRQKSALAALREFFDLSPLWLKGAVGFAAVLLCVMVIALVMSKQNVQPTAGVERNTEAKYTEQELRESVEKALKEQQQKLAASAIAAGTKEVETPDQKTIKVKVNRPVNRATQWVRRSLSKSEREQLAADLRLLSTSDEDSLSLIGEKINQDF